MPIRSVVPLTIKGGEPIASDSSKNTLLAPMNPGMFLNHKGKKDSPMDIPDFYEYYIHTTPGDVIILIKK